MKNRDFIITGLQSWDIAIGSNAKNIAIQISQQNRVLYINPPQSLNTKIHKWSSKSGVRQITPTLFVADLPVTLLSINSIKWPQIFDTLNMLNNSLYANGILKVSKRLGFKEVIHINDNDIFRSFSLGKLLEARVSIYYRRDYLWDVPYWAQHAPRLEPLLCRQSDLVLTNSPYLAQTIQASNPHTYYIGQGVDTSAYDPQATYPIPPELEPLKFLHIPIIGYTGVISSLRLDADLIDCMANLLPNYMFVMVGSQDQTFEEHTLHNLRNIIFMGAKSPNELPMWVASFDVCFNPQLVNRTTEGNYPRKIDEYLALGKPTVATHTPTMEIFAGQVSLCKTAAEFAEAIEALIATKDDKSLRASRTKFAAQHTWENSVELIYQHINEVEKR